MKIAVTSQNLRTITGHGGKSRRFLIYQADGASTPTEIQRLDLPKEMSLHEYHGDDHPLFGLGLDALITASCGAGFVGRLGRHGVRVHTTSESDPVSAVEALAAGRLLPPPEPHSHCPLLPSGIECSGSTRCPGRWYVRALFPIDPGNKKALPRCCEQGASTHPWLLTRSPFVLAYVRRF